MVRSPRSATAVGVAEHKKASQMPSAQSVGLQGKAKTSAKSSTSAEDSQPRDSQPVDHVDTMDIIPLSRDSNPASSSGGDEQSRVVYIGHLPHGFYEKQLLGFFGQFGKLTRVRLSRNKKTAKAKHYAYLEFQYPEVAKIAADTMDGYFMFAQKLSVRALKQSEVHPNLFKGGNRKFKTIPWRRIAMERHNKERSPEEHAKRVARLIKKDRRRQKRIAAAGIEFEYEGLADKLPVQSKKTVFK